MEFALIAPVFLLTLIGLFDMAYNIYTASLLEGAIQKAARDSTIEGASESEAAIDARVTRIVRDIVPSAQVRFMRKAYTNFSDASLPEDYSDLDGNGTCNDGEPYEDVNGNGLWDTDRGRVGMGGARDAVLYEVTVSYARKFPLHAFLGVSPQVATVARTVLRNQPYGMQEHPVPVVENCS